MAVNTKMPLTNTADGYLCEGTDIRGGYFVIDKTENIPNTIAKTGSLCYCTDSSKFYQFDGMDWVEKEFGTTVQATASSLGLVKIGYTENDKNYPVELNNEGQMYVNVPWEDTNTWRPLGTGAEDAAPGNHAHNYLPLSGGGILSGGILNANGNILISNDNPHVGFTSNGKTAYIQTYNDNDGLGEKIGFGYSWSNSMKVDSSGNIYEKGTSLSEKYQTKGNYAISSHKHNTADITDLEYETFSISIKDSNGASVSSLTQNSTYTISAGGATCEFKTPVDNNTKVTQTYRSTNETRPLLLSANYTSSTDSGSTEATSYWTNKIYANPSSGQLTAKSFYASSDRRLKENIKEFIPQKSILELPIVEFDFKDSGTHQIGCIAQDLQEICPEIVNTDDNGYLSISESKLSYLLLLELKKLREEFEAYKASKE